MNETVPAPSRVGAGQWLLFLILASWLAVVPLVVVALLSVLTDSPPDLLIQQPELIKISGSTEPFTTSPFS